mmetsp:Transcript_10065/g.26746  ORF Transcript_10065/g.26746 Transcript_10065/m.26746 type:complete len:348 (-) Transcript_10065:64-1107(-)
MSASSRRSLTPLGENFRKSGSGMVANAGGYVGNLVASALSAVAPSMAISAPPAAMASAPLGDMAGTPSSPCQLDLDALDAMLASATAFPEIVHLNVGGWRYTTTLQTLTKEPNSRLCGMFSGSESAHQLADGSFFINRDGSTFTHILNFLRDGSLPIGLSRESRLELMRESRYYGLARLHESIGGQQAPHDPGVAPQSDAQRGHAAHRRCRDVYTTSDERRRSHDEAESMGFLPRRLIVHHFARLRYGHEYNGDWIVSSPRNLPGVDYELHGACLARGPIEAINLMSKAGWRPCDIPPKLPPASKVHAKEWRILMVKEQEVVHQAAAVSSPAKHSSPSPTTPSVLDL